MKKLDKVMGKEIKLGGGRCVFVSHPPGSYMIEFTSKEGSVNRLCLTEEGMHALCILGILAGIPVDHSFRIGSASRSTDLETQWQLVPKQEA